MSREPSRQLIRLVADGRAAGRKTTPCIGWTMISRIDVDGWVDATGRLSASDTTARATATATAAGRSEVWTVTTLMICSAVCTVTMLAAAGWFGDAWHCKSGI